MKITLRPHLLIRLNQRKIPASYPQIIVTNPDEKFIDLETNHRVAVKIVKYDLKLQPMAVSYDIINEEIQIITIHPISKDKIQNRVRRRRWVKYEKS